MDGSFKIEFIARPDLKIAETDEPTFVFQINTDVTDSAGETRSAAQTVRVGYTALEATLAATDWQTVAAPVEISANTRTLDGEPQVAEGRVMVYDLQAPAKPQPASMLGYVPNFAPRSIAGQPSEENPAPDLSNPNNWPLGKIVAETGFTTDTNGSAKLSFKLPVGAYRAVIETQDRFGKKVSGKLPLHVLDPDAMNLAIKLPHLLAAPEWQTQPGEEFSALWGTGYGSGRAFIEIEHRHKMLQRYWTRRAKRSSKSRWPSLRPCVVVSLFTLRKCAKIAPTWILEKSTCPGSTKSWT